MEHAGEEGAGVGGEGVLDDLGEGLALTGLGDVRAQSQGSEPAALGLFELAPVHRQPLAELDHSGVGEGVHGPDAGPHEDGGRRRSFVCVRAGLTGRSSQRSGQQAAGERRNL